LAAAGGVEAVLDRMADRHHRREVEEAGTALDGVEAAEYRIEAFAVGRAALQRDHLFAQLVEDLARLDQEVRADIVAGVVFKCSIHGLPPAAVGATSVANH